MEVEGREEKLLANGNRKQSGMAVLIPDKQTLNQKFLPQRMAGYVEDRTGTSKSIRTIYIYAPKRSLKIH